MLRRRTPVIAATLHHSCPPAPPTLSPQVKQRYLENGWSFARQAVKYDDWMAAQVGEGG